MTPLTEAAPEPGNDGTCGGACLRATQDCSLRCVARVLSFLDRAAISQAAPYMVRELHLSAAQMGLVFPAFGITYALGEIPSGWLCDRFGPRRLLTRVVLLWSLFTAATGWAWNFLRCW